MSDEPLINEESYKRQSYRGSSILSKQIVKRLRIIQFMVGSLLSHYNHMVPSQNEQLFQTDVELEDFKYWCLRQIAESQLEHEVG